MYEAKPPAAWRGRPLSPAIRLSICAPRDFFCEISEIVGIIEGWRPTTPPTFPFFIGPGLGRLSGYDAKPFTRAFPRGAAWASAPGHRPRHMPPACRSSHAVAETDSPSIYLFSYKGRAFPPSIRQPSSARCPRRQATPAGHGGLLFPLRI